MMNVLELARQNGPFRLASSSIHGGEYSGACPSCGGTDRFRVWPEAKPGGRYWCRGCRKKGDNIQFLIDFDNMNFQQAAEAVGRELKDEKYRTPKMSGAGQAQVKAMATPGPDPDPAPKQSELWLTKAAKFAVWAHKKLKTNPRRLQWLHARGIKIATIRTAYLGWNPGDERGKDLWRHRSSWGLPEILKDDGKPKRLWIPRGLVIPNPPTQTPARIRIRRHGVQNLRYYVLPGSNMDAMTLSAERPAAIIVESELDAILINQEAGDLIAAVALGNAQTKPHGRLLIQLQKAAVILVALDYDKAGADSRHFWKDTYPQAVRWPVPSGTDPGDMHEAGESIREWIKAGLPAAVAAVSPGPSLLCLRKGGASHKPTDIKPEPYVKPSTIDKSSSQPPEIEPIEILQRLLQSSPVVIDNRPEGLRMREPRKWGRFNWKKSQQISILIFGDCFDYIRSHPDQIITAKNLIKTD